MIELNDVNVSEYNRERIQNAKKVAIEGHRGGKFDYDNTFAAFHKAVENGLQSIEFDVWLTKDKVPVVIHGGLAGEVEHACPEFDITETTHINDIPLEHLKQIILPNGEQIPTLEEVLDEFNGKISFNCEVKEEQLDFGEILLDLLVEKEIYDGFLVSSFVTKQLESIKKLSKEQNVPLRYASCYEFIDTLKPEEYCSDGDIITFDYKCLRSDIVKNIQESGKKASVYFYPSSDETDEVYPILIDAGVDIIITDRPQQLKTFLNQLQGANHN